jgi:organic hydroperoxide reductase OsmC/OhrA
VGVEWLKVYVPDQRPANSLIENSLMLQEHTYRVITDWSGAEKSPEFSYESYSREYSQAIDGKQSLIGSADPNFFGDASLHNPEDLLVMSLSSCHMLSYLALCARAGIRVLSYTDVAIGKLSRQNGKYQFTEVTLHPKVVIEQEGDVEKAKALHQKAHEICFITNSVAFPVLNEPAIFS